MVCKHCGNQLSLEDAKCPFCGQENVAARKHVQEMRHFSRQFRRTSRTALEASGRVRAYVPLLVLIGVLAAANIIVLTIKNESYWITELFQDAHVKKHEASYYSQLEELENAGRYVEMGILYDKAELYGAEALREFRVVAETGETYGKVLGYAGTVVLGRTGKVEAWELSSAYSGIGNSLRQFYDLLSGEYYRYEEEARSGRHEESLTELRREMELVLAGICGLTEKEIEESREMDAQRLSSLIRQSIENK